MQLCKHGAMDVVWQLSVPHALLIDKLWMTSDLAGLQVGNHY